MSNIYCAKLLDSKQNNIIKIYRTNEYDFIFKRYKGRELINKMFSPEWSSPIEDFIETINNGCKIKHLTGEFMYNLREYIKEMKNNFNDYTTPLIIDEYINEHYNVLLEFENSIRG